MRVLDRKVLRDIRRLFGQALAIALVTAVGTAVFVMSMGALRSLEKTQADYYVQYRFADVFASVRRAPDFVADRLAAIAGVRAVTTRITHNVVIDIQGLADPVNGLLSSIPSDNDLNQLHISRGRPVMPGSSNEAVLGEAFADAHELGLGDTFSATIKGRKRTLTLVGTALSPEYVFFGVPGTMVPDDRRFGVLWMDHDTLAAAFDLKGAFNDLVIALSPGADEAQVLNDVDRVLKLYGGISAYGRADHVSNATLMGDIAQLRASIYLVAPMFVGVVAFLLHMLMMRHIETERAQIGTLKAFGYTDASIALHYLKLVLSIVAFGVALGLVVGAVAGQDVTELYARHYRFPFLHYEMSREVLLQASVSQLLAAILGALGSLRRVFRLPPAVAMRAPPPPVYRATLIERVGFRLVPDQPTRMILRHIFRWPLRSLLTTLGISAATASLVVPLAVVNSAAYMVDTHFFRAERQDLTVALAQTRPHRAIYEVRHYPGVLQAEPFRATPVRIIHGWKSRRVTVLARDGLTELARPLDLKLAPMETPREGVILSRELARWLKVSPGEEVGLDLLETGQGVVYLPVVGISASYVGLTFFTVLMDRSLINRLLLEGDVISGMQLSTDPTRLDALYQSLKDTPAVTGVVSNAASLAGLRRILAENHRMTVIFIFVAAVIIFGVIYNSAQISLAERARELASMRLLGFSRLDVSYILVGELLLLTLAAIPTGLGLGYRFAFLLTEGATNEMFRIPLHVEPSTFGLSTLVALGTAMVSALVISRKIFQLDIVSVLKASE